MGREQREIARRLVGAYEGGPKPGTLEHALKKIGDVYVNNAVTRHPLLNKTIGRKGLQGAVEDLVRSTDPITMAQTLKRHAEHPLRIDKGVNAGIVIGGGGAFRVPETADLVRPRTRPEAEARLARIDAQIEKTTKAVEKHIGHPLFGNDVKLLRQEQLRRNRINGLIDLFEKTGKRRSGTAKALRSGRKPPVASETTAHAQAHLDALIEKHPDDPVLQHYSKMVAERNHLAAALERSPEEMFGGDPSEAKDYGSVPVRRGAPAGREVIQRPEPRQPVAGVGRMAQQLERDLSARPVEPVKVADVPNLPGIERSPEELRAVVAGSLGAARRIYAEQKAGYAPERSSRVAKGMGAYEEAGGGLAGHQAFMRAQRGELPKEVFDRLSNKQLSQADLETLVKHAYDHPDLQPYEKMNVVNALRDAIEQKRTPAPHEIDLLRRAYGEPVAQAITKLPWHKLAGHYLLSALNVPRTIMASADVSAPFRQGLIVLAGHPGVFAKNFGPMFKAFGSEHAYQDILTSIHERPNFPLYKEGGVKFTELGRELSQREEQFQSDLAERIPLVGRLVRASGRAYTGFLDLSRADVFDQLYHRNAAKGRPVESTQYLKGIANYANAATGRGNLGPVESWAPALNAAFFSPRLIASRINFLNPYWIARLPRGVRLQAARSILQLGFGAGVGLYAAHRLAGASVNADPRNADFAKLRYGDTRVDILGGFQQYLRLGAQLYSGKIVSSTTGKTLTLGHGFGQLSREDILKRFAQAKFSPPVSLVDDFLRGTTYAGAPVKVKTEIVQRLIPLVVQDAYDLYNNTGSLPLTALMYGVSAFGIGMQTYGPTKRKRKGRGGGGGRDPNPLLGGGSGSSSLLPGGASSSNPYLP